MNKNVLLCGVGGQGIVLAAKLLSSAAMKRGIGVRTAETIGMAQRGGSVTSHLRMGEDLYSPLIPKGRADLILSFEPGEAVRALPYLKKDGLVVTNSRTVSPVSSTLSGTRYDGEEMIAYLKEKAGGVIAVDGDLAAQELGSAKVLNVVLLGAALCCDMLPVTKEEIRSAVRETVAEKFWDINLLALDYVKL